MNSREVRTSTLLAYGLPGLAAALPIIPVAILLPTWYARDLGLGFVLTGSVLALARLLDFISDPIVGVLVDRIGWRGLHYKFWTVIGAALAAPGLLLLAFPPQPASALALGTGAVLLFSGWTAFMIPYTAWGAELSRDRNTRSLITASREVAGLIGMLVALAVPAWLVIRFGDEAPPAMVVLAGVAFVVGIPALFALLRWVPEPTRRERRVTAGWRALIDLLRVGDCRRMLICWLLNGIANGLPAVLFPLVVSDFLQLGETQFYFLLVVYFASAIAVTPAWLVIARRRGKSAAWSLAIAVNMVVFAQVLWLGPQSASWFFAICLLSGATLGADLALPPSIQADIMESDRVKSGLQRTATGFALWSMATKLALAIAVALAFVVGGMGPSGSSVVIGSGRLLSLYVIVPVLLKGAVYVLLRRGSLSVDLESMTQRPQAAAK